MYVMGIQVDMARFGPASVLGQAITFARLKFGQRTLAAAHTWPSQAGRQFVLQQRARNVLLGGPQQLLHPFPHDSILA